MPAGLRSKDSEFLILLASSSSPSCYSPILCPRSGLLVDYFVLRPVAELATSTCWYGQPLAFLTSRLILYQALTFVLAPLPNALFSHCGADEFAADYEDSGALDVGRFITSMIVVTGFALPTVLAHANVIDPKACVMSVAGGGYVIFNFETTTCPHET